MISEMLNNPDIRKFRNIDRWNGHLSIKNEDLSSHSFFVTMYSSVIVESLLDLEINFEQEKQANLLLIKYNTVVNALFHDVDEIFTSDLPYYLKHNNFNGAEIREKLDNYVKHKIENVKHNDLRCFLQYYMNPEGYEFIKKVNKISDWMSMYSYCRDEAKMGNQSFIEIQNNCFDKMKEVAKSLLGDIESGECLKTYNLSFNTEVLSEIIKMKYS